MALDYLSGVMCAIVDKRLSSAIGFKGIAKKVLILMLVGVASADDFIDAMKKYGRIFPDTGYFLPYFSCFYSSNKLPFANMPSGSLHLSSQASLVSSGIGSEKALFSNRCRED